MATKQIVSPGRRGGQVRTSFQRRDIDQVHIHFQCGDARVGLSIGLTGRIIRAKGSAPIARHGEIAVIGGALRGTSTTPVAPDRGSHKGSHTRVTTPCGRATIANALGLVQDALVVRTANGNTSNVAPFRNLVLPRGHAQRMSTNRSITP